MHTFMRQMIEHSFPSNSAEKWFAIIVLGIRYFHEKDNSGKRISLSLEPC